MHVSKFKHVKNFVESTVLGNPHLVISNLAVLPGFSLKHRKFHHIFVDIIIIPMLLVVAGLKNVP